LIARALAASPNNAWAHYVKGQVPGCRRSEAPPIHLLHATI
jgi:hypothetical protein